MGAPGGVPGGAPAQLSPDMMAQAGPMPPPEAGMPPEVPQTPKLEAPGMIPGM